MSDKLKQKVEQIGLKSVQVIVKDFELMNGSYVFSNDIENLKYELASKIKEMLQNNIEKLMSILYRIDVPQQSVDIIFEMESKDEIPVKLSEAIINRQLEKARTRHYYKNSKGEQH